MKERKMKDEFLERLIIKGMMTDKKYTVLLMSSFKPEYFDNENMAKLFTFINTHYKEYQTLPNNDIIINSLKDDNIPDTLKEIDAIDYSISKNYEHLFKETNYYLKEKSFKDALLKGVELVEQGKNPLEYKSIIEDALSKDLAMDLGTNYFDSLNERLKRVLTNQVKKTPTFFPIFDEFISGGFPPYTLSVIMARIHGMKTNFLVNMATRQVLNGFNPVIFSMEMSEEALCQRIDAIYSKLDINRIYIDKKMTKGMVSELKRLKNKNGLGTLIIKEFPTGKATCNDFSSFIKELHYRGIDPNPIFCDYIQIMGAETKSSQKWRDISDISKDLRALSLKEKVPVISVSQGTREFGRNGLAEADLYDVGGSIDIASDSDFMAIFGQDEDSLIYENEIHYKIVKNRIGGRVGDIGKLFIDKKSLKMYDETELDIWLDDKKSSGDERIIKRSV